MNISKPYYQAFYTMRQVQQLLNWTEDELFWFKVDKADEYLRHYLSVDEEGQELLKKHKEFWAWWNKRWQERDEQFLAECLHASNELAVRSYEIMHNGKTLSTFLRPLRRVTKAALPVKS